MHELVLFVLALFTVVLVLSVENTDSSDGSSEPQDSQYCTEHGCPDEDNTILEVDSSTQSWNILSTIQDTLTSVKDTIKYNVYKTGEQIYNTTAEFAEEVYSTVADFSERVRVVFREEFNSFLEVLWERAVGTDPASDSMFWKLKEIVVHRLLALGLIILCLILDYIIWNLSTSIIIGIMWILTFDSAILLAYKLLGPLWVYWAFWRVVGYTWYTLSFIWTYPYTSACIICGLFIFSVGYFIKEKIRRRRRREWLTDQITIINDRLRRLEEQQNEILKTVKETADLISS